MQRNSIIATLVTAGVICFVCSIMVSGAAVSLRPIQKKNAELDKKRNILAAAGIEAKGEEIEKQFQNFETRIVDLSSGELVEDIDPKTYDQKAAAKDPEMSIDIPATNDVAGLGKRAKYAQIFLYKKEGKLDQIILPIRGPGLWSMLYGFIAIDKDTTTVRGLGYYQHAETPGLGGEVDNPLWKQQWPGKQIYGPEWELEIEVLKGKVDTNREEAKYQVDGLSGATITTRGVDSMLKYWLGDHGFGPFLKNMRTPA